MKKSERARALPPVQTPLMDRVVMPTRRTITILRKDKHLYSYTKTNTESDPYMHYADEYNKSV